MFVCSDFFYIHYHQIVDILVKLQTTSPAAQRRFLKTLLTVYKPPLAEKAMAVCDELLLCERSRQPIDALTLPRIAPKVIGMTIGVLYRLDDSFFRLRYGEETLQC